MLYAVRGNKQLKIDEADKRAYLNQGYDIAEEKDGKLETIEVSPSKTVPYAEFKKSKDRIETLEQELESAQSDITSLKGKLAEANKKLKEAGKE